MFMNRIIVLGSSGSGKSTLARRVGELLDMKVIHLDSYYWQPNWVATPETEWIKKVETLLKGDRWVMDGNYLSSLELRLRYADAMIFIDQSRWMCLWRCIQRLAMYRGRNRPELADGCNEKMDLAFFKWIWNYPRDVKPIIENLAAKHADKQVIRLRDSYEMAQFLTQVATLKSNHGG